jgi:hypothetical protein
LRKPVVKSARAKITAVWLIARLRSSGRSPPRRIFDMQRPYGRK